MSDLFSYIGWAFLPTFATKTLLTIYYRLILPAGQPPPSQQTARYQEAHRKTLISLITLYLLYTIYDSYYHLPQTHYELLDIPNSASEKHLRVQWRKLNLLYHPDKVGEADEGSAERYFVRLQHAYEVLSDPIKRFAYDRFGGDISRLAGAGRQGMLTQREFIVNGHWRIVAPYYVGTGGFLLGLSVLGKLEFGRYWRFLAFASLLVLESFLITRPYNLFDSLPTWLTTATSLPLPIPHLPPLLPYEQILLARKTTVAFFIALSQIGPLLTSPSSPSASSSKAPTTPAELTAQLKPLLDKLHALTGVLDQQAGQAMMSEFMPFQGREEVLGKVEGALEGYLIETQIRGDEGVREAMGRVVRGVRR